AVFAVDGERAFDVVLELGEQTVGVYPEFGGASGFGDGGRVGIGGCAAAAAEGQEGLGAFFGQVAGPGVVVFFQFRGPFGEFLPLGGGGLEVLDHAADE